MLVYTFSSGTDAAGAETTLEEPLPSTHATLAAAN